MVWGTCKRSAYVALGLSLAILLVACATKPAIRSDVDRDTDFAAFQTFGFAPQLATDRAGYSTLVTGYFKQAVQREMQARGYQYSEKQPQLLVNFNTNVREVTDIQSYPSSDYGYYGYRTYGGMHTSNAWYGSVATVRYKVGTANVDLIDVHKNQLVWEGVAEGELTKKVMENPQAAIEKVVQELFKRFPVPALPTASPDPLPAGVRLTRTPALKIACWSGAGLIGRHGLARADALS